MPAFRSVARVVASWTLTVSRSGAGAIWRRFAQAVALVPGDEAVDHRIKVAGFHELWELVVLEIDPVVGDARLRIVIGTNFFAAVARAHGRTTNLGQGLLLLRHLAVEQAGHQHLFRLGLVLELRALILAGDHDRRTAVLRRVSEAHCRVRRIDALPAVSAGTIDIDLEPFGVDGDIDLFGLRHDHHRGRRGVNPALRLRLGHPLHAVHAILELQPRVCAVAANLEDHFFEAAPLGHVLREQVDLPPPRLGVAAVHAEEVSGKQARLVPTGPLPNFDDDVLVVGGILGHERQLELAFEAVALRLLLLELLPRIGLHLRIPLLLRELASFGHGVLSTAVCLVELHKVLELGLLLAQPLELLEVSVDHGIGQPFGDRVVPSPNGFELFEHQAAASFSSWRAAWNAARATSSWRSSGSRVVSFWVRRNGMIKTLTTGLLRWRPANRMNS